MQYIISFKRYWIASILTWAAGIAMAQTPPAAVIVQQYTYAPVGIAAGTTLRLNFANVSDGTTACVGNLSFINSDGSVIKDMDITVNTGQTVSYALLISDISGAPAGAEVRGFVKIEQMAGGLAAGGPIPACTAVTSLEVAEVATGQTRAILTNPTLLSRTTPTSTPTSNR